MHSLKICAAHNSASVGGLPSMQERQLQAAAALDPIKGRSYRLRTNDVGEERA
jgi:hypothetical protein